MRTRALVSRPGRKVHFASIAPGETTWIAVCDREVPVFGVTEHGRDWPAWLTAAHDDTAGLCRQCRTPLLVAALALSEVEDVRASNLHRERLEAEVRTLREQVSQWVTAAIEPARAAARRREVRADRRLTKLGL